jgi:hypothetical protein
MNSSSFSKDSTILSNERISRPVLADTTDAVLPSERFFHYHPPALRHSLSWMSRRKMVLRRLLQLFVNSQRPEHLQTSDTCDRLANRFQPLVNWNRTMSMVFEHRFQPSRFLFQKGISKPLRSLASRALRDVTRSRKSIFVVSGHPLAATMNKYRV